MVVMMIGKRCLLFDPYEYTVMKYAYQFGKGKEFRISDMHAVLLSLERMKIGKYSTQSFLNQLAAKRVMKKRYIRTGFFKWEPLYHVLYDEKYFLEHTRHLDFSTEAECRAWRKMVRKMRIKDWHMRNIAGVITEPVHTVHSDDPKEMERLADRFFQKRREG